MLFYYCPTVGGPPPGIPCCVTLCDFGPGVVRLRELAVRSVSEFALDSGGIPLRLGSLQRFGRVRPWAPNTLELVRELEPSGAPLYHPLAGVCSFMGGHACSLNTHTHTEPDTFVRVCTVQHRALNAPCV